MGKPTIGLVMIVRNEVDALARLIPNVAPLIDTWTICDTGSSDDTKALIRGWLANKPGRLYEHKWRSFGGNLTMAHARARGTARWLLRLDADMTVEFDPGLVSWLRGRRAKWLDYFMVDVLDFGLRYKLPLLVRGDLDWRYLGPTHEYLDISGRRFVPLTGLTVHHHSDGSNREAKLQRDIELLRPGFRKQEERAVFYTAECHRYLGNDEQAALTYELRATLGGFEEERWYASYQAARLRRDVGALIEVWRERPWRHEPLTAASRIVAESAPDARGDKLFLEAAG